MENGPFLPNRMVAAQRSRLVAVALTLNAAILLVLILYSGLDADSALTTRDCFFAVCIGILGMSELLVVPWKHIDAAKTITRLLFLWSVLLGSSVTIGVVADGGLTSPLILLYPALLTFFALAFRVIGLFAYVAILCISYMVGTVIWEVPFSFSRAAIVLGQLAITTFVASVLSIWLQREMFERAHTVKIANARAGMLAIVGRGARRVISLDESSVLHGGLSGAIELGCYEAQIWMQEHSKAQLTLRRSMGQARGADDTALARRLYEEAKASNVTVREVGSIDTYIGCLIARDTHPAGMLLTRANTADANDDFVLECLEVVAAQIGAGLEVARNASIRKDLENQLAHWAFHDSLTDLPNRVLFADRLELAIARIARTDAKVAVLFLDLDGFKAINDEKGHGIGDALLVAVARRLQGCLRPNDTLARYGGDEFVILLEQIDGHDDAVVVARRVLEAMKDPFVLGEETLVVRTSVGVALTRAGIEAHADVLRRADVAMYQAKSLGGSRFAVNDG